MEPVQLIAVFAENKLGQFARLTKVLADVGANLRWVTFATSEKFGVIKILVDDFDGAVRALQHHGWTVSPVEVLAVEVEDQPGGMHAVAEHLTERGINIENASGFVFNSRAILLLEVNQTAAARRLLAAEKLHLLSQEELLSL